jgi:hypothetical protein
VCKRDKTPKNRIPRRDENERGVRGFCPNNLLLPPPLCRFWKLANVNDNKQTYIKEILKHHKS